MKYEYKTLRCYESELESQLNKFGQDGWKLVDRYVTTGSHGLDRILHLTLERIIEKLDCHGMNK